MSSFAADVDAWVAATEQRMKAVRDESAQRLVEIIQTPIGAGGNMPVRDGFLRASLIATTGGLPAERAKPEGEAKYSYDAGQVNLTIVGANLRDDITFAFVANYAIYQELGSRGRAGRRFVGLAAQQWGRIVEEVTAEAKARAI